jgi:hypothetical protein
MLIEKEFGIGNDDRKRKPTNEDSSAKIAKKKK